MDDKDIRDLEVLAKKLVVRIRGLTRQSPLHGPVDLYGVGPLDEEWLELHGKRYGVTYSGHWDGKYHYDEGRYLYSMPSPEFLREFF